MTSRRLAATLALLALVSNVLVFAKPGAGRVAGPEGQAFTLMSLKTESAGATTRFLPVTGQCEGGGRTVCPTGRDSPGD